MHFQQQRHGARCIVWRPGITCGTRQQRRQQWCNHGDRPACNTRPSCTCAAQHVLTTLLFVLLPASCCCRASQLSLPDIVCMHWPCSSVYDAQLDVSTVVHASATAGADCCLLLVFLLVIAQSSWQPLTTDCCLFSCMFPINQLLGWTWTAANPPAGERSRASFLAMCWLREQSTEHTAATAASSIS